MYAYSFIICGMIQNRKCLPLQNNSMLRTVYASNPEQLSSAHTCHPSSSHPVLLCSCPALTHCYTLQSHPPIIKSKSLPLLYSIALYLYTDITRDLYNSIQSQELRIETKDRRRVKQYLSRVCIRKSRIKWDWEAQLMMDFVAKECGIDEFCMVIKFVEDLELSTISGGGNANACYFVVYFMNEELECILETFSYTKYPISDQIFKRKLQFLNLLDRPTSSPPSCLTPPGYLQTTLIQHQQSPTSNNLPLLQSNDNSVITQKQQESLLQLEQGEAQELGLQLQVSKIQTKSDNNVEDKISQMSMFSNNLVALRFQYFVVYGIMKYLPVFQASLKVSIAEIGYTEFRYNDSFYNNPIFTLVKDISHRYNKLKPFQINNGNTLQLYYHTSINKIFNAQIMKYNTYKTIKITNILKNILKDPHVRLLRDKTPDLITFEKDKEKEKEKEEYMIGPEDVIEYFDQAVMEKFKKKALGDGPICSTVQKQSKFSTPFSKSQQPPNTEQPKKNIQWSSAKKQDKKQDKKSQIQFLNNLEINENNITDVFVMTQNFKMQEEMSYKIDIGEYIRIVNRVKKCPVLYVVFEGAVELLRLLTIIEQQIDFIQVRRVLQEYETDLTHKPKQLKTTKNETTIKLQPISPQDPYFFPSLLQNLKKDPQVFLRTIACTTQTLKLFLQTQISYQLVFAVPQPTPTFQLDTQIQKQTLSTRMKINKMYNQYYNLIKCQISNKDYKDSAMLRKEQNKLRDIFKTVEHQYQIGDYVVSQIDQYNVSYMIAEGFKRMFFVLSKQVKEEYVYLTYMQKLFKVYRNRKGIFEKFQDANFRDISKNNQKMLKPVLNRAFLTGQKYISINLPFQHIKQVKLKDITILPQNNKNLLSYYKMKINQSQRYKVCIKPPYDSQYIERKFSKNYVMKFQNQKIRQEIKRIDLGYGGVKKWRQDRFVCIRAQWGICLKILHRFQVQGEGVVKKGDKNF